MRLARRKDPLQMLTCRATLGFGSPIIYGPGLRLYKRLSLQHAVVNTVILPLQRRAGRMAFLRQSLMDNS